MAQGAREYAGRNFGQPRKRNPTGLGYQPALANLFLHYAFDRWMQRENPDVPFERYADHAICHCRSEARAQRLRQSLEQRFAECGLQLHPQKTRVVYCQDTNRTGEYSERSFDFLGYTFRPRSSINRDREHFVSFLPAVSKQAAKRMRQRVRRWRLHLWSDLELEQIATWARPVLSGWVRYYGRFYPSKLRGELRTIDEFIVRWAMRKYNRFRGRLMASWNWLHAVKRRKPQLFAHWVLEQVAG
jgi:RNA-directed DNA polymerase